MRVLLRGVVLLCVVLAAGACAPLLRSEPFVRGTIVGVGDGWVDLRHKSGRVVRILIPPQTGVVPGGAAQPTGGLAPRLRSRDRAVRSLRPGSASIPALR